VGGVGRAGRRTRTGRTGRMRMCARGRACRFLFYFFKYDDPQGKQTVFYAPSPPLSRGRARRARRTVVYTLLCNL
jgi:hypothetical protein